MSILTLEDLSTTFNVPGPYISMAGLIDSLFKGRIFNLLLQLLSHTSRLLTNA